MELMSRVKMARFHTFWIQMRKNKPLDESPQNWSNLRNENGILLYYIFRYLQNMLHSKCALALSSPSSFLFIPSMQARAAS
ncbi:hypothetical protein Hanom_Chr09g00852891 [Helianthus anomalus]